MKILAVAASTLALLALPGAAQAFHPSDDNYGYVMPDKIRKARGDKIVNAPKALFGTKPKPASITQSDDDDDAPSLFSSSKPTPAKGKKQLTGGGKPNVSPVAPPKVAFPNSYGSGTIIVDTAGRKLYYVLSSSTAYRYPIAVGKAGFTWTGTEKISNKVAWPDWRPPAEMLARRPDLPEYMEGGVRNPLGARALYLGKSLYRIHGTNDSKSIGTASSSGCIRMTNGHVVHLAGLAGVGTTVHVLGKLPKKIAKAGTEG